MAKIVDKLIGRTMKPGKPARRIVKKPKQKKNPNTGNTSTAPAASPKRLESGGRLKEAGSPGPQKAYDRIQGEIKWLEANGGSPESIAKRKQSLKDMFVTKVIKKKPMKDIKARVPADAASDVKAKKADKALDADVAEIMAILNKDKPQAKARGGMAKKKVQMMRGGMAGGKEHMYAAGGNVMDNLTSGQKKMVASMAKANK